tara:strand:- start:2092 stop:2475 length:384 start_codon:yes stop_codon:yes gene_type:complete
MAYRIQANRKNLSVSIHAIANTGSIVVAGNNSVSNVAISDEVITGAYITQIWAGSPSGNAAYWEIKRGSNTVMILDSTTYFDFAGCGNPITLDSSAPLSATLVNSVEGFIVIELQKEGTFITEYLQN